ncbi:hypothetical protein LTR67_003990 [Exophiala xenobiotica]
MSSRNRPLAEVHNSRTPTRHAPLTPHALRAFQQRSGAKTRSYRKRRAFSEEVRPDSARGILRQLAKITAPLTKKTIPTPAIARGKENKEPGRENSPGVEAQYGLKRPRLSLDIDDSLDDDSPPHHEEEEDSELPVAPTPSILPGEDDELHENQGNDPTITFKSIDFATAKTGHALAELDRRRSRLSFYSTDQQNADEADDEPTILTEIGRRAISEEPTGRLSRYSFGSIRMSDFGSELEFRRDSGLREQTMNAKVPPQYDELPFDYEPLDFGGETENLDNLQKSPSLSPADESTMQVPALDHTFQFEMVDEEVTSRYTHQNPLADTAVRPSIEDEQNPTEEAPEDASLGPEETSPLLRTTEEASLPHQRRQKKVKMTRHGEVVPSLPSSLIRRVATEAQNRHGNRKPKLGRDHMKALEQATEWFFEQVGEDLEAYSDHARRKKRVDRSDVLMLMQRQKVLQGDDELRKAAQDLLPKEVLDEFEEDDS